MGKTRPSADGAREPGVAPAVLTRDENAVICLRLGLDGQGPRSVEEIAMELGFTRQRIRRLERSALQKLSDHEGLSALAEALDMVRSKKVGRRRRV